MAEAPRLGNLTSESKPTTDQDETFCVFNVLCLFISLITILADLTTDILVFAEYCKDGYLYWALATLIFILSPNILINIFSMRWFAIDKKFNIRHWITHGFLVGLLERYVIFLHAVFACKNLESIKTQKLISQRNDLSLLHFLYLFIGTIPQIILQSYAIVTLDENYHTKAFSLTASIATVIWGCATYIYSITAFTSESFQWSSLTLKLIWHFGLLIGRISGILLFTIIFGIWTLVPLGLHWSAMTFWIIIQKTTFCPNKLEETFYNVVMGLVYCFCYINLREGHTRYRLLMFYTLIVTQNFGSLLLYVLISNTEQQKKCWSITATVCIIAGTVIGLCAMLLYYRYFHSKGPISWKNNHEDVELNNKVTALDSGNKTNNVRSFKSYQKDQITAPKSGKEKSDQMQNEVENADKKFLLDHWIARSGSPMFTSVPVGNTSKDDSVEFYSIENTPQSVQQEDQNFDGTSKRNTKIKKRTVCSPIELTLKLSALENLEISIDEITSNALNIHKRRGICSSDELRDELANLNISSCNDMITKDFIKTMKTDLSSEISHGTDCTNKKTSSDSIDMDLDLSFSDINSSDINTFNENIVQKLCLSALKNIKVGNQDADIENIQRIALDILKEMYAKKGKSKSEIKTETFLHSTKQRDLDTPTEMLSVHDYENICAVNIAREAWGLRSWNGYSDIENWLHDGSVVRERRRDTLTSGSSEISSCISQELKNAILAAPPFPKKTHTYSNVFVKFDRSNQDDYIDTVINYNSNDETFLAKPCMVDIAKDTNHLEPIIEELDDLGDVDPPSKKRLNSESSLVATIDEIRKATVTNSPRHLYHRREHLLDSPQFNKSTKIESNLKKALWKEPSKFDSSNIMVSLPEKENILNESHGSKFDLNKKDINILATSTSLNIPENISNYNRNTRKRLKSNIYYMKTQKKFNNKPEHQDLSNKDIDFLWQLVSENSLPLSSAEHLSSNRMTSSLQSLIDQDSPLAVVHSSTSKIFNVKKGVRTKPRRKFSILRERFEPMTNMSSDEEILYHHAENSSHTKNYQEVISDKQGEDSQQNYFHLSNSVTSKSFPCVSDIDISKKNRKRDLYL